MSNIILPKVSNKTWSWGKYISRRQLLNRRDSKITVSVNRQQLVGNISEICIDVGPAFTSYFGHSRLVNYSQYTRVT